MKNFNKTIQMLIFDGNPNGLIMCELSNWNGRVYKVSRSNLRKLDERIDANNTGIYFLLGKDEDNNNIMYIGEAEKIFHRLKQHLNDKIYWNDIIFVVSKDNKLNKAHVKYLENSFYNIALQTKRTKIFNATIPTLSSVDEFDKVMLEEFIENTKLLVNTLGNNVLESVEENIDSQPKESKYFYIKAARGANGVGAQLSDGFVVFKDSVIANPVSSSMSSTLINIRQKLINDAVISNDFKLLKDHIFTSPSLAAAIVMGRNANGRTEWKTKDNKTLKEIEED